MATTTYFEKTVSDFGEPDKKMEIEVGHSSYNDGIHALYLKIDGESLFFDAKTAAEFSEAVAAVASYLGLNK